MEEDARTDDPPPAPHLWIPRGRDEECATHNFDITRAKHKAALQIMNALRRSEEAKRLKAHGQSRRA